MKIKVVVGIGSEGPGIGIKLEDVWGGEKHRNPKGKQYRRQRRFEVGKTPPIGGPTYYDRPTPTTEAPTEESGEYQRTGGRYYEYPDPYGYEQSEREAAQDRDKVRGPPTLPTPGRARNYKFTVWQVVFNVLHELWKEVDERNKRTKHRWDYDDPLILEKQKANSPVIYPRKGQVWIPPEWEPPQEQAQRVEDKIAEMGRIIIGPLIHAEPDLVVWEPYPYPGGVRVGGQRVKTRVERRGRERVPEIVVEPTAEPTRPVPRPTAPAPVPVPALPAPAPAPRAVPKSIPNPPPWAKGVLQRGMAAAVTLVPLTLLPSLRFQTAARPVGDPKVQVRVKVKPQPQRWYDQREHQLRYEEKKVSDSGFMGVVRFLNRTWGHVSEIAEFGEAVLQSTHRDRNDPKDFGYKRWDVWSRDIRSGRAEVDWQELIEILLKNEIEDRLIGKANKLKIENMRRHGADMESGAVTGHATTVLRHQFDRMLGGL